MDYWNSKIAEDFGKLATLCVAAGKDHNLDVILGLNTQTGKFTISWSEKPYEYGKSVPVTYRHMLLSGTDITLVTLRLEKTIKEMKKNGRK